MRSSRLLLILLITGAAALIVCGLLALRQTSFVASDRASAEARIAEVRALFPNPRPLVVDVDGSLARSDDPGPRNPGQATWFRVLVYSASHRKLVETGAPLWLYRLKAPLVRLLLRKTGFDIDRLGVTPADFDARGPGVLYASEPPRGDLVLVWLQ